MTYVFGVDGGATKTRAAICDGGGKLLADKTLGPSNFHITGIEAAASVLDQLFSQCLEEAGLKASHISYAYLGLSGADLPDDFRQLNVLCADILGQVPFTVDNDCWISLRSGLDGQWGAVSICGTGANAAAVNPNGKREILRALTYEVGNFGGGGDLAKRALHMTFRADDGVGVRTMLEQELPKLYDCKDMNELVGWVFPEPRYLEKVGAISPLVFQLASKGDRVCQDLLIEMGQAMGEAVSGVIRRAGMADLKVPVVLGGSLYRGENPLLVDQLTTALHRVVPKAFVIIPQQPPVAGACLLALDKLGIVLAADSFKGFV